MKILSIIKKHEFYKLKKFRVYAGMLNDYKKRPGGANWFEIFSIHRKGFLVTDWKVMNLTKDNYKKYLSSKQYNKYHPINGYYTKLIDDKITIKYILSGTELAKYTPDYYFLIDETGQIFSMMDVPVKKEKYTSSDVLELLKAKHEIGVKLITGTTGKGFHKCEYRTGKIYKDEEEISESQFSDFLVSCKNYIVMEYLRTHDELAAFWPTTANTLRYLLCRVQGEYYLLKSFIRFGSEGSGQVESFLYNGGVLCYVNDKGYINGGYVIDSPKTRMASVAIVKHPNNGKDLQGRIPMWDEIEKAALSIAKYLPETKYLGFDFVVTDKNEVKLLEINSLSSLDVLQIDCSILETEVGKSFFANLKEY